MKKDTVRNIPIIAHVDHGKTTLLVDELLQQSGTLDVRAKKYESIDNAPPERYDDVFSYFTVDERMSICDRLVAGFEERTKQGREGTDLTADDQAFVRSLHAYANARRVGGAQRTAAVVASGNGGEGSAAPSSTVGRPSSPSRRS